MSAVISSELPALRIVREPEQVDALRHPDRRRLLESLVEPGSATSLAPRLGTTRQRLNYHLRELERAGLVRLVEERRRRNCVERVVQATARAYVIAPELVGDDRDLAGDRFSSAWLMAQAARTVREVGLLRERAASASRRLATLTLETEIRFATAAERAAFADELARTVARLAARYHDEGSAEGRRFRVHVGVHPAVPAEGVDDA